MARRSVAGVHAPPTAGFLVLAIVAALLTTWTKPAAAVVTFTVNSAGDASDMDLANGICDTSPNNGRQCTLRAAIQQANDIAGPDKIIFAIGTGTTLRTISPDSPLPAITDAVSINGYTQAGASENSLTTGNDAVIKVQLNGTNAGAGARGLEILGDDIIIRGLAINRFVGDGILITGSNNVVDGNFIGTNAAGTADFGNASDGVAILGGSNGNTIGGTTRAARNLISGNDSRGVLVAGPSTSGTLIQGNYIGTDAAGTTDLGNTDSGVLTFDASGTTIGGTNATTRNILSGNDSEGVSLSNGTSGSSVIGNYIGTDPTGASALGNSNGGVRVSSASDNTIGGLTTAERNVISGNGGTGVVVQFDGSTGNLVLGNRIGTDVTGNLDLGNSFHGVALSQSSGNTVGGTASGARNVISGNAMHGVALVNSGASNSVVGNRIGTNAGGTAELANDGNGVLITTPDNVVGGTEVAARNVISGNGEHGVEITGSSADGNVVQGNRIGTSTAGTAALPNGEDGVSVSGAADTTIGGTQSGARNVISGNTFAGVSLIEGANNNAVLGNFIGVTSAGTAVLGNGAEGLLVTGDSNDIGGTAAGSRNVISGNREGVVLEGPGAADNDIEGNFVGTDVTGTAVLGNLLSGVSVEGGGQNSVGGSAPGAGNLISGNGGGVRIIGSTTANAVMGNLIGTDAAGTAPQGNLSDGVVIDADGNTIGGTASGAGNVISANLDDGIQLSALATGNTIQGNRIGTVEDGTAALGNAAAGISVQTNANGNLIGGTVAGAANLISGNGTEGIFVSGADGNTIQGNRVGTAADGTGDLGNLGDGVFVTSALGGTSADDNVIGGTGSAANLISGNGSNGVLLTGTGGSHDVLGNVIRLNDGRGVLVSSDGNLIQGNLVLGNGNDGVEIAGGAEPGEGGQGNRLLANQILGNAGLGIDLAGGAENSFGVTANDTDDPDTGANDLQNFPVIASATRSNATGGTTIIASLNSNPNQEFTIQFFLVAADPSNHGEGQVLVATRTITTNANGDRSFSQPVLGLVAGHQITATATNTATGNTSEFALNRTVVPGP